MITDQGCPTDAPNAKLFMSSEPEVWYGDVLIDEAAERGLCDEYRSFIKKVTRCQGIAGFSRFRVYGEINQNREHVIVLVTEFQEFKDDHAFWACLEDVRSATEARLWIMRDAAEVDHTVEYNEGGMIGEAFGPDHGRELWQVELSWRIEKLSYREIEQLIERMVAATAEVWMTGGVGVC